MKRFNNTAEIEYYLNNTLVPFLSASLQSEMNFEFRHQNKDSIEGIQLVTPKMTAAKAQAYLKKLGPLYKDATMIVKSRGNDGTDRQYRLCFSFEAVKALIAKMKQESVNFLTCKTLAEIPDANILGTSVATGSATLTYRGDWYTYAKDELQGMPAFLAIFDGDFPALLARLEYFQGLHIDTRTPFRMVEDESLPVRKRFSVYIPNYEVLVDFHRYFIQSVQKARQQFFEQSFAANQVFRQHPQFLDERLRGKIMLYMAERRGLETTEDILTENVQSTLNAMKDARPESTVSMGLK